MTGRRTGWGAWRLEEGDQLISSCLVPDQNSVRVCKGESRPRDPGGQRRRLDGRMGEAAEEGDFRVSAGFCLGWLRCCDAVEEEGPGAEWRCGVER